MPLNIEKILAPLREIRENLGAPLIHINQRITQHLFLYKYYNRNYYQDGFPKFHFMPCSAVKKADLPKYQWSSRTDGKFPLFSAEGGHGIKLQELKVCSVCIKEWNEKFPNNPVPIPFDIEKFLAQCGYHPEVWDEIKHRIMLESMPSIPFEMLSSENKQIHSTIMKRYLLYNPVKNAPFHFMKCLDIRDKEQTDWIKTYRFTPNLSGNFYVYVERTNGSFERTTQRLRPCGHCLSEWNGGRGYKNYSTANNDEKERIMFGFNIIDFFDECAENQPELNELYELMNDNKVWFGADIRNNYPEGIWQYISRMYRIAHRYCCEQCGVDLSAYAHSHEHGDLLVVHHVNGSHPDVGANNMKVLCKECHSKQPYHENTVYRNNPASQAQRIADHNLLNNLRRSQGLSLLPDP